MSQTYSYSESVSFTVTHARQIAAKVATDLKRIQRLYGSPSDEWIRDFEAEVTALLLAGYLGTVTYGYRRDGVWIEPMIQYTANYLAGAELANDDPGRLRPGADTTGASFYSYLTYSPAWDALTPEQRHKFKEGLPFYRVGRTEPRLGGYVVSDKTYSGGGRALARASLRS